MSTNNETEYFDSDGNQLRLSPDARYWLIDRVLVTAVSEAGETAITLTVTTADRVRDARSAILAVDAALRAASDARRETHVRR